MDHHHKKTNLVDTQEHNMENNETEQYELYEETKNDLILEEELDKTFTSPTMNSGIMEIYHNDPENIMHLVHCNQLHTNEIQFFSIRINWVW